MKSMQRISLEKNTVGEKTYSLFFFERNYDRKEYFRHFHRHKIHIKRKFSLSSVWWYSIVIDGSASKTNEVDVTCTFQHHIQFSRFFKYFNTCFWCEVRNGNLSVLVGFQDRSIKSRINSAHGANFCFIRLWVSSLWANHSDGQTMRGAPASEAMPAWHGTARPFMPRLALKSQFP